MNFTHTMIKTNNLDAAVKFYCDVMDMKIAAQKSIGDIRLCFLSNSENSLQLELMETNEDLKNEKPMHLGFAVESMDEFAKKINNLGYKFSKEPFDITGHGSNVAFLYDNDGYEIEVVEKVVW